MQYHIQTLVKHLFDKDSFEQVTVQELKEFTEAYPYATVGQFLYAKKLYDARSWNYYEQTEQASLYFHNPLWYRWLMDQKYEAPPVLQRQEEQAQQNAFRVVVQMPKGVAAMAPATVEEEKETVAEAIAETNRNTSPTVAEELSHTEAVEAFETVEAVAETAETELPPAETPAVESAADLQQYLPEIDTEELQATTEAFGDIQADGTPPAEYTETVTDNTSQQPQEETVKEAPVYTEEYELNQHEEIAEPEQEQEQEAAVENEKVIDFTEGVIVTPADIPAAKEEVENTPEFFAEAAAEQEVHPNAVAIAEQMLMAEENVAEEEDVQTSGDLLPYQILDTTNEIPVAEATEEALRHEEIVHEQEQPAVETPVTEEPVAEDAIAQEQVTEENAHLEQVAEAPVPEEVIAQEEPVVEETVPQEPVVEEPVSEPQAIEPEAAPVQEETVVAEQAANEPVEAVATEPIAAEPVPQPEWKAEPTFTQASKEPKTAIDTEEPIFESYHTIDYFASQGIKLREVDYKDRLGKQLKSFTEWLRSMKRIVPTEANASLDEITNQTIVRQAEHSVEEKEVITEAMAEVWAKQGHPEKAIAVYEKLSLLNPDKSPYFAGRIEQLKAL